MRYRQTMIFICLLAFFFLLKTPLFIFADEEPKRDIFKSNIPRPVAGAQQTAGQAIAVNLQGISIGAKNSFAVVNGLVLHEGEEKSGIKVVKIRRREVDIEISGVPRTLEMVVHEGMSGKGPKPETPASAETLEEPVQEESSKIDSGTDGGL